MERKKGQRYSKEFRRQAVERMRGCDNIVRLAHELGICRRVLYNWRDQLDQTNPPPIRSRELILCKQILKLKRLLQFLPEGFYDPSKAPLTLAQINEQNRTVWLERNKLRDEGIKNRAVLAIAMNRVRKENEGGLPLGWRKIFEQQLADAADDEVIFHANFSRKGRAARKSDVLQGLIVKFVHENLSINERQLFHRLKIAEGAGIVTSIDLESKFPAGHILQIHFVDRRGRPKTAHVRGLKDRLFRAKAQIKSLQPPGAS